MSLILCKRERINQPFYVDALGIHIYSSQELCYVILHHPFLVMDGFFTDALKDFIAKELEMPYLVSKITSCIEAEETDQALILVLQECDYASPAQISAYRQKIEALRTMHPAYYAKEKADYYYQNYQYGMAVSMYERALAMPKDAQVGDSFMGNVWNNLAGAYVNLFYFDKAMRAFECACDRAGSKEALKQLYLLTKLRPELTMRERYAGAVTEEWKAEWDAEFDEKSKRVEESAELKQIHAIFDLEGEEQKKAAVKQLAYWKREYRSMI